MEVRAIWGNFAFWIMRTAFPPVHFIIYTALNSDRRQKTEQSYGNHQATKDMNAKEAEQKDQRQVGL